MTVHAATESLLRRAYDAFNARDIDAAIALMHADVDWPNAMEGTRVHGHAGVRDYWTRQFTVIDSRVEPESFSTEPDGRVVVSVHQVVRDRDGNLLSDGTVEHVYTVRDGLVARMEIATSRS
jgi:ketosteroid isomerase-like protein